MSPQIFMSYSHANMEFATELTSSLERAGFDVWLDHTDIKTGSHWDDEIVKGLDASQVFMVLLSVTSVASQNVKDEIGYAIDHNKPIVPLLLEPCEIPFRLRRVQYVDFTSRSFNDGLQIVLNLLRSFQSEINHQKTSLSKDKDMDPTTLAASVSDLVVPNLARGDEQLPEKIGNVWKLIVQRFKKNPSASGVANDLAQKADDPDKQEAFTHQLINILRDDTEFVRALSEMMEQAQGNISNAGSGTVATSGSISVGHVGIRGNLNGNIVIGNNNQVSENSQKHRKKSLGEDSD